MISYRAPRNEFAFLLHDFLRVQECSELPGYAELTPDFTAAVLDGAAAICEQRLQPLNRSGDEHGCRFDDGQVRTPPGFREAYRDYVAGGWPSLGLDPRWGGQGLPQVLSLPVSEILVSANMGFSGYIDITQAACALLEVHGTKEQQRVYLPPMVSGHWSGAMHITEAQAGSDVGLLRTKARLQPDGSYRLQGSKIFITGVDHDMTENVVNLVLARIEGAPAGSKGISLFLVPKFLPDASGHPGQRNGVVVTGIEHKMGVRASATCSVNYEEAVGYMVGAPEQGLRTMFTMINDTRLGVGVQGLGIAEVAYQNARAYAKERLQGRAPGGPVAPELHADPIVHHPDVRRMLALMKGFIEPGRALALWTAMQIDTARRHADSVERQQAEDCVALLTPVIKAHFTETAFDVANLALQCFGGHGYIRESGVEQFVRDIRIGQIYEGTNATQALDLVQRKIHLRGGAAVEAHFQRLDRARDQAAAGERTAVLSAPFGHCVQVLRRATDEMRTLREKQPLALAAAAGDYLRLFALVTLGWMDLELARADHSGASVPRAAFSLQRAKAEATMFAARAAADARTLAAVVL